MDDTDSQFGPDWNDDQKMSVMFAPFREKSLNPQSWDKKLKFWADLIMRDFKMNHDFVIDLNELSTRYLRKGKKPKCLETVIQEMLRMKKLQTLQEFHQTNNSGWISWGMSTFVKRPLNWGLGLVLKNTDETSEQFIITELLKEAASQLLENHYASVSHESTDNIVEMATVQEENQDLCKNDSDLNLVLTQLEKEKKIIRMQINENDVIVKFCKKNEKEVKPIEELELNVNRIQRVRRNLEKQIEQLSEQADIHTKEAQLCVRNGKKRQALHSLRKRQTVQKLLDKKSSSVDMLDMIIHRIEDAATNEKVLKAYETGMNAIKDLTKKTPMDRVETVTDDLHDVLEDQSEVNEMMSTVLETDVTKDELEEELEELLKDDREKTAHDIDDLSDILSGISVNKQDPDYPELPEVPKFSPSGSCHSTKDISSVNLPS